MKSDYSPAVSVPIVPPDADSDPIDDRIEAIEHVSWVAGCAQVWNFMNPRQLDAIERLEPTPVSVTVDSTAERDPRLGQLKKALKDLLDLPRGYRGVSLRTMLSWLTALDETKTPPRSGHHWSSCVAEGRQRALELLRVELSILLLQINCDLDRYLTVTVTHGQDAIELQVAIADDGKWNQRLRRLAVTDHWGFRLLHGPFGYPHDPSNERGLCVDPHTLNALQRMIGSRWLPSLYLVNMLRDPLHAKPGWLSVRPVGVPDGPELFKIKGTLIGMSLVVNDFRQDVRHPALPLVVPPDDDPVVDSSKLLALISDIERNVFGFNANVARSLELKCLVGVPTPCLIPHCGPLG